MQLRRRGFLGAALAAGAARPLLAHASVPGLNELAAAKGMRFGSCVAWSVAGADRGAFANPAYARLLERDCGILVPENELKWQWTRPGAARFDFSRFDPMLAYAEAQGMAMRGHTLLWHKSSFFPRWLNEHDFGPRPRDAAERMLIGHIRTVCGRYGKRIFSYDVVNETIDEKTGEPRETSLSRAFGDPVGLVELAFRTAREAAPHAELVYNDYMSWELGNAKHRAGVLRLLEGFRKRGVPVDALGVQSHIGIAGEGSVARLVAQQQGPWRAFLDAVTGMGYRLVITEFDVNDARLPTDAHARDRIVADYAAAYLDVMFDYPQLRDLLVWGMNDRYGWLNGFRPRADGTFQRATPYDGDFRAKPLYRAIADAFERAAPRPT